MHFPALTYLALLALSAKGTFADAPPNGYAAFYSIFDHIGCDSYSRGLTTVEEGAVGKCLNFTYPATSVTLESFKEGCSLALYPYVDCRGRSLRANEVGCTNSWDILMSAMVTCSDTASSKL